MNNKKKKWTNRDNTDKAKWIYPTKFSNLQSLSFYRFTETLLVGWRIILNPIAKCILALGAFMLH